MANHIPMYLNYSFGRFISLVGYRVIFDRWWFSGDKWMRCLTSDMSSLSNSHVVLSFKKRWSKSHLSSYAISRAARELKSCFDGLKVRCLAFQSPSIRWSWSHVLSCGNGRAARMLKSCFDWFSHLVVLLNSSAKTEHASKVNYLALATPLSVSSGIPTGLG